MYRKRLEASRFFAKKGKKRRQKTESLRKGTSGFHKEIYIYMYIHTHTYNSPAAFVQARLIVAIIAGFNESAMN